MKYRLSRVKDILYYDSVYLWYHFIFVIELKNSLKYQSCAEVQLVQSSLCCLVLRRHWRNYKGIPSDSVCSYWMRHCLYGQTFDLFKSLRTVDYRSILWPSSISFKFPWRCPIKSMQGGGGGYFSPVMLIISKFFDLRGKIWVLSLMINEHPRSMDF